MNKSTGSVPEPQLSYSQPLRLGALEVKSALKNTLFAKQSQFLLCWSPKNKAKTNPFKANSNPISCRKTQIQTHLGEAKPSKALKYVDKSLPDPTSIQVFQSE
ncbi:MAG: hypothetical protein WCD79_02150 [Chthoniobacteraceae bacterium]